MYTNEQEVYKVVTNNSFSVLRSIPAEALSGMHPQTKKIVKQLKTTKGRVLACRMKNPHEAKIRMDALRRAKARGHVRYLEAHRKGGVLYFRLR